MNVWVTASSVRRGYHPRFHKDEDCVLFTTAVGHVEVDLEELEQPEPCRLCYPTAPKAARFLKRRCRECGQTKLHPCAHNGGVLVRVVGAHSLRDEQSRYVWPDQAHKYKLVRPLA